MSKQLKSPLLINEEAEIIQGTHEYLFHLEEFKEEYRQQRSFGRSVAKGLIGITLLGGVILLGSTMIVPDGHVGLRKTAIGQYILLPPGRYSNLPGEVFVGEPVSLSEDRIQMGPFSIVTVKQGEVGISYLRGKLVVLPTGQHVLRDTYHTFDRFISLKRETMRLDDICVNTKDNVALRLHPDVVYQIEDALLAITGIDNIEATILDTAEMTMSKVIGSHKLNDIMAVTGLIDKKSQTPDAGSGMVELIYELEETLSSQLHAFGVRLLAIGIRGYDVLDAELSNQLAQSAVLQANISAQLQTAENEALIVQIRAEAEKLAAIKEAEGEAEAARVRAQGMYDAARIIEQSEVAVQMTYNNQNIELVSNAQKSTLFFSDHQGSSPSINLLQPNE